MYVNDGKVYIEEDDQCSTCKNFAGGVACPLIHALGLGVVMLEDSLYVSNCGFYEKFERKLSVVKTKKSDKSTTTKKQATQTDSDDPGKDTEPNVVDLKTFKKNSD